MRQELESIGSQKAFDFRVFGLISNLHILPSRHLFRRPNRTHKIIKKYAQLRTFAADFLCWFYIHLNHLTNNRLISFYFLAQHRLRGHRQFRQAQLLSPLALKFVTGHLNQKILNAQWIYVIQLFVLFIVE